jgi:hypothetical protein
VTVPDASFFIPGTAETTIEALEPGLSGNVEALAIDRIEDKDVDRALRGPGQDQRRIRNDEATAGGDEQELLFVKREDVDQLKGQIREDLQRQFTAAQGDTGDRLYAGEAPHPRVTVPEDLVGQVSEEDQLTFELTGRLVDRRPYVLASDAEAAATEMLLSDSRAVSEGTTLDQSTILVELGDPTLDGETITVPASVSAAVVRDVDEEVLRTELAGMTADQAEALLAQIGPSTVELWPAWVDRVPRLGWRVTFDVQAAD